MNTETLVFEPKHSTKSLALFDEISKKRTYFSDVIVDTVENTCLGKGAFSWERDSCDVLGC